jgi:hypothetical protein
MRRGGDELRPVCFLSSNHLGNAASGGFAPFGTGVRAVFITIASIV